ncbi:MAG: adenylate/guanylate cyclase domain-containing protein, partial [Myxococcales bacterium]
RKLLILIGNTCLVPVLVLGSSAATGFLRPSAVLYAVVSFTLVGLLQGWSIVRSIDEPVRALARQMARVTAGDLSARAEVVSADEVGRLSAGFNAMVDGLRRAAFVRDTFGRYVDPAVVEQILAGNVALGGEVRTATVLFSDIRGFTALAEQRSAPEVVKLLNRYLDAMVEVLVAEGATIDKFIGDAVVATFGVPVSREDDARRAVRAALAMLERLEALNATRPAGEPALEIGIGLHTGEVVAGNIGSARKMEYTVIGDTVNTAARIEQLTKHFGAALLISDETRAAAGELPGLRALPPVEVKGKRLPLQVFEVVRRRADAA